MNKKQRIILIITAILIFISLLGQQGSTLFRQDENLVPSIEYILLFGVPGWLLHLAFKDREIKK